MAAPLPAVHNIRHPSGLSQSPIIDKRIPSPPSKNRPAATYVKPSVKLQGRRDREQKFNKQHGTRQKQPELSSLDTERYRNTFFHNLCLGVLKDGFHRSFSEVFSLVKQQQHSIEAAGPDSLIQDRTMLADQHEKLIKMKQHLTEAELALRIGNMDGVYTARHKLAEYFLEIEDLWLSDHFYQSCLETAKKIPDVERRSEGQAHCNMGLAFERRKDYISAAAQFEAYYNLALEKQWKTDEGISLHSEACEHLRRLYTSMANHQIADRKISNTQQRIEYLTKAHEMAKQSRNGRMEADASYRLGLAYEDAGDSETALSHLTRFMDLCKNYRDQEGMGRACEAIAKSYERQGKLEDAVRYLEMFVELAEQIGQERAQSQACSRLGEIFNSLGDYEKASLYFGKSYTMARSTGDNSATEVTRILFGVSSAHKTLGAFAFIVDDQAKANMRSLMEWKDSRKEDFVSSVCEESD